MRNKRDLILEGLIERREKVNEMTVQELLDGIGKHHVTVITKDGVEGISLAGLDSKQKKFVEKNVDQIKALKNDIVAFLKKESEAKAKEKEDYEKKLEDETNRKISEGESELSLVWYGHYNREVMIAYMENIGTTAQGSAWERKDNHQIVKMVHEFENKSVAEKFKELHLKNLNGCYNDGLVYYITKVESNKLIESDKEVTKAIEEKKKVDQELKTQKAEKEKQDALDKAKSTGKPQTFKTWNEECNDRKQECSLDIVSLVAMPDGSIKTTRTHTF